MSETVVMPAPDEEPEENQIQKRQPEETQLSQSYEDTGNFLQVIAQAARDPQCDVAKMRDLIEMQRDLNRDLAEKESKADYMAFHAECPPIKKESQIAFKGRVQSTYASYEDIWKIVGPIMSKHGFGARYQSNVDDTGVIASVTCIIMHRSGHSWDSTCPVAPDHSGSKNSIQATGSAISYGKRYALMDAMNIVCTDEDDDGAATGEGGPKDTGWQNEQPASAQAESAPSHVGGPEAATTQTQEPAPEQADSNEPETGRDNWISQITQWAESQAISHERLTQAFHLLLSQHVADWRDLPLNVLKHTTTGVGQSKVLAKLSEVPADEAPMEATPAPAPEKPKNIL